MKQYRLRSFGFFCALVLVWACDSGSDSKQEEAIQPVASENQLETLKNQISLALVQKNNWLNHWAGSLGGFDESDFIWVFTDSIDPMEMPEKNPILEKDPLRPYQIAHPEGDGVMDIYSYKVEAQEGLDRPFLNPDSEVIWYRSDGMKERLLFIGPSGMFEEGLWLSPVEFLVLGYFEEDEGFRPMVWMINTEKHQLSQFKLNKTAEKYLPASYLDKKLKSVDLASNGN
ncbi:MAG: hypothetical protein ACJLTB_00280 [Algoriphagus aquaeductus]|uniref:hypothetical protein n=1 Tax=Algoriphagus TaxID=246875 RepID=UPI00258CB145|nr:hypothetical protein [Algoriphagus sp.]